MIDKDKEEAGKRHNDLIGVLSIIGLLLIALLAQ